MNNVLGCISELQRRDLMQRSVLMISAAESDLKNLPFDAVQSAHVLELAKRLDADPLIDIS